MKLGILDTILFAILVLIVLIEFYWTWQDRKAGKTPATGGVL